MNIEFKDVSHWDDALIEQIRRWRNDDGIRRFMYQDDLISPEQHRRWLESIKANPTKKYWVPYVDGRPSGLVNLVNIDRRNKNCEWAFYVADPLSQKTGLGRIAEFHTLDYVFLTLELEKLNCAVLDFNQAVINMHKGFGFREEGFLREQIQRPEGRCGIQLLGMTRQEWLATRESVREKKMKPLGDYTVRYTEGVSPHADPIHRGV